MPALFGAVSTSTDHLSPWLAWASVEPLEQGLGDFISHSIEAFERGDNDDDAIWNFAETTLVGGAGLHPRLALVGSKSATGSGLAGSDGVASTAARALTTTVFQLTGTEEVHIHCHEANLASGPSPWLGVSPVKNNRGRGGRSRRGRTKYGVGENGA